MYKIARRRTPQVQERPWIPVETGCVQPFDRVFVVSLARRPDRLDDFWSRGPGEWPWKVPALFEAVDGEATTPPKWFKPSAGAWGCLQSHVAIWEMQIKAGWDSVLVLEDDADFCLNAVERMQDTLDCVPDDWDQIYFGGQHLDTDVLPPETVVQDRLVRGRYINRTHAYAIRLPFAEIARDAISQSMWSSEGKFYHVDYRLGELHATGNHNIYAPWRFCVGQGKGTSDVRTGRGNRPAHVGAHFWNQFPIVDPVGVA